MEKNPPTTTLTYLRTLNHSTSTTTKQILATHHTQRPEWLKIYSTKNITPPDPTDLQASLQFAKTHNLSSTINQALRRASHHHTQHMQNTVWHRRFQTILHTTGIGASNNSTRTSRTQQCPFCEFSSNFTQHLNMHTWRKRNTLTITQYYAPNSLCHVFVRDYHTREGISDTYNTNVATPSTYSPTATHPSPHNKSRTTVNPTPLKTKISTKNNSTVYHDSLTSNSPSMSVASNNYCNYYQAAMMHPHKQRTILQLLPPAIHH